MLVLIAALAFMDLADAGDDGHEFSGSYELNDITYLDESVSVTVTLEIVNHRDAAVYDVTLIVPISNDPDAGLHELTWPLIGSRESGRFSTDLVMEAEKFETWLQGVPPMPCIEFTDGAGTWERSIVEITLTALAEEN